VSFENRYSTLDRLLHRFAFGSSSIQLAIADLEDKFFASELEPVEIRRPVFVTGLPRAGTTILLETIESLPEFVSHTYRNMPFVLCPILWDRFSSRFRRQGEAQERAHQDGILVTTESPEAFEEIIWKAFWQSHYERDRISPWVDDDQEFFDFLRHHMRKIIALSQPKTDVPQFYLSKNNLNIARIELLLKNFPDAVIIVPFREPLQHAASLLRQHRNFLEIHREDRFARDYMAGIGHYDFGENLRPVNFGGWLDRANFREPARLPFWLEYWFETYNYLAKCDGIYLLCYEDLCAAPSETLTQLAKVLLPNDRAGLLRASSRFRSPRLHSVKVESEILVLLNKARELYESLRVKAG
jgi:hypothetical protein